MSEGKLIVIEKAKLAYLRHGGNVLKVAEELGCDVKFAQNLIRRFRKKDERDVSVLIADTLMTNILHGHEARIRHILDMLDALAERGQLYVSLCCHAPVTLLDVPQSTTGGLFTHRCMKCNKECRAELIDKLGVFEIKQNLLTLWTEQDRVLIEMADKMGYTNKVQAPAAIIRNTQNIVVMGGDGKQVPLDKQVVADVTNLSYMDRERLIKELEKKIADDSKKEELDVQTGRESEGQKNK